MSVMTEIERGLTNRKSQMCKAVLSPVHLQFFVRQLTDDETKSKTSTKQEIFAPQSLREGTLTETILWLFENFLPSIVLAYEQ